MTVTRAGLIGALIVAVSLNSGCSFLFVKGPPAEHAQMVSFECSESNAWPVVDVIWAGLNGLGAASAAGDKENPNQDQIVAVGLAWLVVSGISAIYGFGKVSQCSDAKRMRDERYYPGGVAAPRPGVFAPAAPGPAPMPAAPAAAPMPAAPAAAPVPAAPAAAPVPAAPAAAPAPAAPAAAPAPAAPGTAPAPPVVPGSTSRAPATSLSPSHSRLPGHLAVRSSPSRSLAMRPALATD